MTVKDVLIYPDKKLREKCEEVDLNSEAFKELCQDLKDTLNHYSAHGIAAPQIGISKRVFAQKADEDNIKIFANPVVDEQEGEVQWREGCLSFPNVEELISRCAEVTVTAYDEDGEQFTTYMDELEAVAAQHEIDHLDGILFIDRVSNFKKKYMLKKLNKWKKRAKRQGMYNDR